MAAPQQPLTPPNPPREQTGAVQRGALDRRIRMIRRRVVTASLVGTAAFSLLAAYETRGTATAAPATPAAVAQSVTAGQSTGQSFFTSQNSGVAVGAATTTTSSSATTAPATTASSATATTSSTTTTTQQSTTTSQATSQSSTVAPVPARASRRTKSSTS